jgi:hypothetical protein
VISGVGCVCELVAEVVECNSNDAKNCGGQKHLIGVKSEGCASVVDHITEGDRVNRHTYADEAEEYL